MIFSQINQAQKILIVCHINPDADTVASASALAFYIESLGKNCFIYCQDKIPAYLDFLKVSRFLIQDNLDFAEFNLIIAVDCADTKQAGLQKKWDDIKGKITTINIDHHFTNTRYADINVVEQVSATSELICRLFIKRGVQLTKEISNALLAGIISDTTFFNNAGTDIEAMSSAAILLRVGADLKSITQNLWRKNNPESLRLLGKILSDLRFNDKYGIVTAIIDRNNPAAAESLDGIANFLTVLREAKMVLVVKENNDEIIKCSLRTTRDNIDVSKLAQLFGGGGHKKAAGFTIKGHLEKTGNGWKIKP